MLRRTRCSSLARRGVGGGACLGFGLDRVTRRRDRCLAAALAPVHQSLPAPVCRSTACSNSLYPFSLKKVRSGGGRDDGGGVSGSRVPAACEHASALPSGCPPAGAVCQGGTQRGGRRGAPPQAAAQPRHHARQHVRGEALAACRVEHRDALQAGSHVQARMLPGRRPSGPYQSCALPLQVEVANPGGSYTLKSSKQVRT